MGGPLVHLVNSKFFFVERGRGVLKERKLTNSYKKFQKIVCRTGGGDTGEITLTKWLGQPLVVVLP